MLDAPATGPAGGVVHRVSDWRSIDGEVFARLTRDRWVGSRGDVTAELLGILGLTPQRDPIVLAVEERAGRKLTDAGLDLVGASLRPPLGTCDCSPRRAPVAASTTVRATRRDLVRRYDALSERTGSARSRM